MVVLKDCLFVLAAVDNLAALVGLGGGLEVHKAARVFPVFKDMHHGVRRPLALVAGVVAACKFLSDFDKKNEFDIEKYLKRRPAVIKPEEPFDLYEIDGDDL